VVRHQTVGVTDPTEAPDRVAERLEEQLAVWVDEEDALPGVAAARDVVQRAFVLHTQGSCHGSSLPDSTREMKI